MQRHHDEKNQRAFNPWRLPTNEYQAKFAQLLQEVRASVRVYDEEQGNGLFTLTCAGGRYGATRAKKMEDIATFHAAAHALVADLIYFRLGTWRGQTDLIGIYIPRDDMKATRYTVGDVSACPVHESLATPFTVNRVGVPATVTEQDESTEVGPVQCGATWSNRKPAGVSCFTKNLPHLLDLMEQCGYLEQSKGGKFNFRPGKSGKSATGQRTLIRPGQALVELMKKYFPNGELSFRSFRPSPAEPIILLKGSKETGRELKDYVDTTHTLQLRADVELINKWYALASMRFDDNVLPVGSHKVDTKDRRIRRVFNNGETPEGQAFKLGGRIGGGWWSNLPKTIRRQAGAVKLNNENVAELDFSCFNPRVLYALNKIEAPQGDLYEVGLPAECRAAVKIVFNAMVFSPKKLSAWPNNLDPAVVTPCATAGVGVKAIQAAIHKTHSLIAHHFHSPERIGFKLLNIESNIVTRVLVELAKQGITALPFHDCVMVCESRSLTARKVMEEVFERETGTRPILKKTKCDLPRVERTNAA